jgi:hypothetical protein
MIKAICKISLADDSTKSIMVHLEIDGNNYTWKVVESSKNGLKLPASNGTWIPPYDWSNILTLLYGTGLMLYIEKVQKDFWESLVNNQKINSDSAFLFNGNPSEEKVKCLLY